MSDASERLKAARTKSGYTSAKSAAEAMGVAVATYIQHENGNRGFPASRAQRYARFFRVTPEWLLYGKGTDDAPTMERAVIGSPDILILGKVAAGVWLEETFAEPDEMDMPKVSYDRLAGQPGHANLFAVELAGDSMNLAFLPNSVLICERIPFGFADVRAGDYVIVERENHNLREMTCKRIALDQDRNFLLESQSTNPKYQEPIRVNRSHNDEHVDNGINIIGKVLRAVQDFSRN